jgi:hypothetical protein
VTSREEIAAAASTVDGVDVSPQYRSVTAAGQGYVEWLRTDYPDPLGGEDYWGVVIVLPTDLAAAQQWIATYKTKLWRALGRKGENVLTVTQARPELVLMTDNQSLRVLVIEGHREDEDPA